MMPQQGGQINPMMMKLMQMLQQQQNPMSPDMTDWETIIPQGGDQDLELNESMGGQPLDYQNQMPYDMEQRDPAQIGEPMPAGMGYGPIGNRMQRMQA